MVQRSNRWYVQNIGGKAGVRAPTLLLLISVLASLSLLVLNATYLNHHNQLMSQNHSADHLGINRTITPAVSSRHNVNQDNVPHGRKDQNGVMMIVDPERTLWTAGWNARYTRYFKDSKPMISWTKHAEDIFEREYRRLHFPSSCLEVRGWMVTKPYWWGLVSVARDYQSDILRAMTKNLTLVHDGPYMFCPNNPERYLNCFWEDFNSCQNVWKTQPNVPIVEQTWQDSIKPLSSDEFPHWLWRLMRDYMHIYDDSTERILSIEEDAFLDTDMFLQTKLSVMRAIMTKTVFKPREFIIQSSKKSIETWGGNKNYDESSRLGLLIHVRRTDKLEDLGPHWRHIDFNSTRHMGPYIQAMESAINASFDNYVVLSDDPRMQEKATFELTPYFQNGNGTQALYSTSLCHFLGSNNFNYTGHESLDYNARHDLYVLLLSDIYAAIQVSDYIIGSGSCGVSQFIAWNLGAKHQFEPSLAAFWEEDLIVKECHWLFDQHRQSKNPITKAMLHREWGRKKCAAFSAT